MRLSATKDKDNPLSKYRVQLHCFGDQKTWADIYQLKIQGMPASVL